MQRIAFKHIVFFQVVFYGSSPAKALHFRAHSKILENNFTHVMSLWQMFSQKAEHFSISINFYKIKSWAKSRLWVFRFLQRINKINLSIMTWKLTFSFSFYSRTFRSKFWGVIFIYIQNRYYFYSKWALWSGLALIFAKKTLFYFTIFGSPYFLF